MSAKEYKEWKKNLKELEEQAELRPNDTALACKRWKSMQGPDNYDYRSGNIAISIFRAACLDSNKGVIKLAESLKELLNDTGETPTIDKFDQDMKLAIDRAKREVTGDDLKIINWLANFISKKS